MRKTGDSPGGDCQGVFAGGDVVTGAATVTLAIRAGQDAAREMNEYILRKEIK